MKPLVYFTGPPGAGKTTLMASLTAGIPGINTKLGKMPVYRMAGGQIVELGQRRPGGFSGTDALSMSIQSTAIECVVDPAWYDVLLLGEGDRLANASFFQAVEDSSRDLCIVALRLSEDERVKRAAERAAAVGKEQNATWAAGRVTKAKKLEQWANVVLDAEDSPDDMIMILENAFDWALELKGARQAACALQ